MKTWRIKWFGHVIRRPEAENSRPAVEWYSTGESSMQLRMPKEAIVDRWDNAGLGETGDNELWKKSVQPWGGEGNSQKNVCCVSWKAVNLDVSCYCTSAFIIIAI